MDVDLDVHDYENGDDGDGSEIADHNHVEDNDDNTTERHYKAARANLGGSGGGGGKGNPVPH